MKIVFSHIEKTAGTSFRVYLYSMFRREQVFWFQEPDQAFPEQPYFLYGGHRTAREFDQAMPEAILLSLLRDPVDRVVSLHRYISKQIADRARPGITDTYVAAGFDPHSISSSLENCVDFRRRSHNVQALSLCGGEADPADPDLAERALDYLSTRPCLIGLQERLDAFLLRLVEHWSWSTRFPLENISKGFAQVDGLYADPRELAAIAALCQQDVRLYQALLPGQGLARVSYAQSRRVPVPPCILPETLGRLMIDVVIPGIVSCSLAEVGPHRRIGMPVRIRNKGMLPFGRTAGYQVNIAYHIRDAQGEIVVYDGVRTELTAILQPGGVELTLASLVLPETCGRYFVEPAIVIEGRAWIDAANGAETKGFALDVTE